MPLATEELETMVKTTKGLEAQTVQMALFKEVVEQDSRDRTVSKEVLLVTKIKENAKTLTKSVILRAKTIMTKTFCGRPLISQGEKCKKS